MIPKPTAVSHMPNDAERAILHNLERAVTPLLSQAAQRFMEGSIRLGMNPKISSGAYAAMVCTNLARITAIAANLPVDLADKQMKPFMDIGYDCQALIATAVGDLMRKLADDVADSN